MYQEPSTPFHEFVDFRDSPELPKALFWLSHVSQDPHIIVPVATVGTMKIFFLTCVMN
jgi:hypothetical protein